MKRFFLIFLFFFPLNAAGPIMHLILAKQWNAEQMHKSFTESELFQGCVFPDIRYVGSVSRDDTHITAPSLERAATQPTAFWAGIVHHSWVDEERELFVNENDAYRFVKDAHRGAQFGLLKLLEDCVLYEKTRTSEFMWMFWVPSLELFDWNISAKTLVKWHIFLQLYLGLGPSAFMKELANQQKSLWDLPPEELKKWSVRIVELAKDPEVQAYVDELMSHLASR